MKKLNGSEPKSIAKLTARQEQAIQSLLTEANVKEAAQHAHVGRTTLYRWLNDPAFLTAYHAAQGSSQAWTVNRLQHIAAKAIQVLEGILDDAEAPVLAQVEAARTVLDFALLSKKHSRQRGALVTAKCDSSLSAPHLDPIQPEGKVAAVLEQAMHKPSEQSLHGP